MKQYIKNGVIFNLPVKIKTDKGILYTTNEQLIKQNGFTEYKGINRSIQEQINAVTRAVNYETDNKILNDFVYRGAEFYLTMQNQTNFANMFIAREYLEYPQQIKTKTGYYKLLNADEVKDFYLAGIAFVKKCLEDGWNKKDTYIEKLKS